MYCPTLVLFIPKDYRIPILSFQEVSLAALLLVREHGEGDLHSEWHGAGKCWVLSAPALGSRTTLLDTGVSTNWGGGGVLFWGPFEGSYDFGGGLPGILAELTKLSFQAWQTVRIARPHRYSMKLACNSCLGSECACPLTA